MTIFKALLAYGSASHVPGPVAEWPRPTRCSPTTDPATSGSSSAWSDARSRWPAGRRWSSTICPGAPRRVRGRVRSRDPGPIEMRAWVAATPAWSSNGAAITKGKPVGSLVFPITPSRATCAFVPRSPAARVRPGRCAQWDVDRLTSARCCRRRRTRAYRISPWI
jgi:hypothetical protein